VKRIRRVGSAMTFEEGAKDPDVKDARRSQKKRHERWYKKGKVPTSHKI